LGFVIYITISLANSFGKRSSDVICCAEENVNNDEIRLKVEERVRKILFFFKQKTTYEIGSGLVGSDMCIRDRS
ncbi:hypothetical protein, partial [Staphylococcus aureus]|uniref:hypothetical protein n=1 Tax=Staphylococcus aureus TaxID=1280 RepID=UPI00193984FC